jgi:hypothetical protein
VADGGEGFDRRVPFGLREADLSKAGVQVADDCLHELFQPLVRSVLERRENGGGERALTVGLVRH